MRNLHIYPGAQDVAVAAATALTGEIEKHAVDGRDFHLALAGGSTPKALYETLAKSHAARIPWRRVHFYFGDDRAVPAEHEHSNYRMAREALFIHLDIPDENIHRIEADDGNSRVAAQAYDALLKAKAPTGLDLVLLGMGTDGHTASLFPGSQAPTDAWAVAVQAPASSPVKDRVSLSYEALEAAKDIWVLVTGASKAERLAAALNQDTSLPIARVAEGRAESISFWVDEPAIKVWKERIDG